MTRPLAGLAVVVTAALASAGGAATRAAHVTLERAVYAPSVDGRLDLAVYLPADYRTSGARYPVVYFLHGLPASSTAYQDPIFSPMPSTEPADGRSSSLRKGPVTTTPTPSTSTGAPAATGRPR